MNPHLPVYAPKDPWYLKSDITAKRKQNEPKSSINDPWYARGQTAGQAATKFRKGACANCGVLTHKTKECVERPRKKGAKWSGKDIKADEVLVDVNLDFEGKRDRWNGYDPRAQLELVKEWELVEEKRKQVRSQKAQEKLEKAAQKAAAGVPTEEIDLSSDDDSDEEIKPVTKQTVTKNKPGNKK